MAAKKRGTVEIQLDRPRIARMLLEGYKQHEIAAELGVSQPMISYEKKIILREAREEQTEDALLFIQEQIDRLMLVMKEAWADLRASRKGRVNDEGEGEARTGNPAYYTVILNALKEMNTLKGTYPAKSLEVTTTQTLNWTVFAEMVGQEVPDVIEGRILKALDDATKQPQESTDGP